MLSPRFFTHEVRAEILLVAVAEDRGHGKVAPVPVLEFHRADEIRAGRDAYAEAQFRSQLLRHEDRIAIVRLDARKPPRLREYDEVARNARELLQRSRADEAWAKLKADLRAGAAVWLDESRMAAAGQR